MILTSSLPSGSYNYPGIYTLPAPGSRQASVGRGPVDAYIVNSVVLTASLSSSDGTIDVELKTLSGCLYYTSATFAVVDTWNTAFSASDLHLWSNVSFTMINNSVHNLKSASLEWAPNDTNWEVWDDSTFILSSSAVLSMQITGNSRKSLRMRVVGSGTVDLGYTGSLGFYVYTNNG